MTVLIDGYNLLNTATEVPASPDGSSEGARQALLDFLAGHLSEEDRSRTTVVFDAQQAPPGLPTSFEVEGITVRFAPRGREADELLEQLIADHDAPKSMTVVSSDHRVQRAARRRRARAVDSDRWLAELQQGRTERDADAARGSEKPVRLSEGEVERWLDEFKKRG